MARLPPIKDVCMNMDILGYWTGCIVLGFILAYLFDRYVLFREEIKAMGCPSILDVIRRVTKGVRRESRKVLLKLFRL